MRKVDTHRHLGGSLQPEWVWETVQQLDLKHLGESLSDIEKAMTFGPKEPRDFHRFLDKFRILDHIPWTEELIDGSIKSVCGGLEEEGIDYCWLDFSINKYMDGPLTWHKHEAIRFIYDSFESHRPGGVGLVLSLKYEAPKASQRQYAELIRNPDCADAFVGLDLVGDERYFDVGFYQPIFDEWNAAGKMTRAHVAESQDAENGVHAILRLKVTNIAHGLKMARFSEMMEIARDHDVTFDLGVGSNYFTGVWDKYDFHPVVTLLESKQKVTLGTDDPVQCSTTLDKEFSNVLNYGVSNADCDRMRAVAVENCLKHVRIA
jgi:adenosine deaminase